MGEWVSKYKLKEKWHVIVDPIWGVCKCGSVNDFRWNEEHNKIICNKCKHEYNMYASRQDLAFIKRFRICLFCWKKYDGIMHCFNEYMEVYGNEAGNPLVDKKVKWHSKKVLAGDTCADHRFDDATKEVLLDAIS